MVCGAEFPEILGSQAARAAALWALRRLRTHCCPLKGFMAARLPGHVEPRAFYVGIVGTGGLAGGLMGRKVAPATTPLPLPFRLSALKSDAAWVLVGGGPA